MRYLNIGLIVASIAAPTLAQDDQTLTTGSKAKLRQIGLAFHNYHGDHGHLPGYTSFDPTGKPLLSWRVHLLPYMGPNAKALHAEFHLDEPWDSPHNKKLVGRMPNAYTVPLKSPLPPGQTTYLVPRSALTLFPPNKDGHKWQVEFRDIYQGLPNIILAVEADRSAATPWTKPSDLPFDRHTPLAHLGSLRQDGFLVAWASGQVNLVPSDIANERPDSQEFLRGLFEQVGSRGVAFYFNLK